MKKEIAEAIVDAGSRFHDLKVFEGYSGRGMFWRDHEWSCVW